MPPTFKNIEKCPQNLEYRSSEAMFNIAYVSFFSINVHRELLSLSKSLKANGTLKLALSPCLDLIFANQPIGRLFREL